MTDAAGDTAPDILVSDMKNLRFNLCFREDFFHLMEGNIGVPFFVRASVDH